MSPRNENLSEPARTHRVAVARREPNRVSAARQAWGKGMGGTEINARSAPAQPGHAGVEEIKSVAALEKTLPHHWIVFLHVPAGRIVPAPRH